MKKIRILALLLLGSLPPMAMATTTLPRPPASNPNIAVTEKDKERVGFAVERIKAEYGKDIEILHPHIIPWAFERFEQNRKRDSKAAGQNPRQEAGETESLQSDEYVVHAYVKFSGHTWFNVSVVLSETREGKISFRKISRDSMDSSQIKVPMC